MDQADEQKKPPDPMTLKYFIDDHQKVLAVVGVFMALSIFFANSPRLKDISVFISFLCFAVTIPLLLQIYASFTRVKPTWLLLIFMNIFAPLTFYVFWFLLMAYRPVWKTQTANIFLWLLIFSLWHLFKRFGVQTKFAKSIERLMFWSSNTSLDTLILKSKLEDEDRFRDFSNEQKEKLREERQKFYDEFRRKTSQRHEVEFSRDSRFAANIIVGIGVVAVCIFVSSRIADVVNSRLDRKYESYIQAETSPTPTPLVTTPTPSTTPSPTPSPSLTETPTPSPTETLTPSKRRKR